MRGGAQSHGAQSHGAQPHGACRRRVGVAITTEQERIAAAFHEGTPALQARSRREEHVLLWIYRSENMGQAARRGSPTSLKIGPGGTAGATSTEWLVVLFECPALGCLART